MLRTAGTSTPGQVPAPVITAEDLARIPAQDLPGAALYVDAARAMVQSGADHLHWLHTRGALPAEAELLHQHLWGVIEQLSDLYAALDAEAARRGQQTIQTAGEAITHG